MDRAHPLEPAPALRVTERAIDRYSRRLLVPAYQVDGCLISLEAALAEQIIALYQNHGTHDQFHSEFKTELDLERLHSRWATGP